MRMNIQFVTAIGILLLLAVSVGRAQESPTEPADAPAEEDAQSKDAAAAENETDGETDADSPESEVESKNETAEEDSVSNEEFLQDPFSYLQSDMQSAVVDLKDGVTKPPAEVTQPRILSRFDLLIEELERQGGGAGQAGQRANRPAQQSSLMRGPGGQNAMRAPRDDGRDWADLSPKERQKILQSKTDGFPAGYDEILADYFRRVARAQEAATAGEDEAEPTTENDAN